MLSIGVKKRHLSRWEAQMRQHRTLDTKVHVFHHTKSWILCLLPNVISTFHLIYSQHICFICLFRRAPYVAQCVLQLTYVVQNGFELTSLLLWPSECWDYKRASPHSAHYILSWVKEMVPLPYFHSWILRWWLGQQLHTWEKLGKNLCPGSWAVNIWGRC